MSKNKLLKLLLVLVMGIAVVFGISAAAGCKTESVFYTVTFDSDGGSAVQSVKVEEGKTVAKPAGPTKEGYTFEGWHLGEELYDFSTAVTKDITLTAKWTENTPTPATEFTVTFDSNGGSAVQSAEVESGKTAAKPADPTKEGFTFGGWYLGEELYDFSTAVTKDITLTAKWTENTPTPATEFTVTFNCDGGKITDREGTFELKQAIVASGAAVAVPDEPVKAGYDFAGWYTANNEEYDFSTAVTQDITLTAKWTPKTSLTVTFDSNGGSEVPQQVVANGGKVQCPADPKKTNYDFLGWCIDKECETAYNFESAVRTDLTLYAKWVEKTVEPTPTPTPTPTPAGETTTYTYSYSAIANKTDGTVLAQADFTGANAFLTVSEEGTVTYRDKATSNGQKGPNCIENKKGGLSVEFKGTGKITISFASTGSSNTSSLILKDANGNSIQADNHSSLSVSTADGFGNIAGAYTVTGTSAATITFTITEAGVYTIYCEYFTDADGNSRGARITAITMTDTVEISDSAE